MEERIEKNAANIENWLVSAAVGCHVSGDRLEKVIRVDDGGEVVVVYSGGQGFGSGGFACGASYSGEKPEWITDEGGSSTQFISEYGGRFRMRAPSVIWEWSYDCIGGEIRWFRKQAYICATDAQIEDARERVFSGPITESEMESIKNWLRNEGSSYLIGEIRNHLETGPESPRGWNGTWQDCFAMTGSAKVGLTKLMLNEPDPEKRLELFRLVAEEEATKKKAEGRAFAQARLRELEIMGLSKRMAVAVMRAAGPGRCVEAVNWAQTAMADVARKIIPEFVTREKENIEWHRERYGDQCVSTTEAEIAAHAREAAEPIARDLLNVLLCGLSGSEIGRGGAQAVLRAAGIEPPTSSSARGLWAILRGAHEYIK